MKHIFFSILTALAFCHCQDPAPGPKNILTCYVRYDAQGKTVKAEASLYDGETKKVVELPGGIRFQSTEMKILPIRGITYSVEYSAKYLEKPAFEWSNKKGGKCQFNADLLSIDSFFFDTPVLSVKNPAKLLWVGKALEKNESLVFMWENLAEGKTVPLEVSTTLGAPMIEIPTAKMAQLGAGDWSLYLVRKQTERTELADYIVESTTEFYTKPQLVKILAK